MSGKYEVNPDSDAPRRPKKQGKVMGCLTYLINFKEGTCMARTPLSWAKICGFYIVYYLLLAGFWAAMLFAFFTTIDDNEPKHQDYQSLIKFNPGMGFRPQPDRVQTLVQFDQGEPKTYTEYTKNLDKFLEAYSDANQTENGLIDCDPSDPNQDYRDPKLSCKYPISNLGEECSKELEYGYRVGRPCVLLKMNKLFNWTPEPFSNDSLNNDVPAGVKDRHKPGFIGVSCEGKSGVDDDNIGSVNFYPSAGFDASYFPYKNQKGYLAPVVMAQFNRLRPGTIVMIYCKIWAANVYHDSNDRAGSVLFEVLMD